jgi:Predicted integral membrane protein (DUF2269)
VSWYETLLFLHLLSAFSFLAAYTFISVILVLGRRTTSVGASLALLRLARPADALAWVGATGTLVFGFWLSIEVEGYRPWDGWILGAFALWLVAEEAIRREDLFFKLARRRALVGAHPRMRDRSDEPGAVFRSRRALVLHLVGSAALLGLLAVMIYKPGAA